MHKLLHTQIQTSTDAHIKYAHFLLVKMKAAIMLSNCAGGTSLFSGAPRPHWNPFSLIYGLWEAHCARKRERERDAVHTSTPNWCGLFICLYLFKWTSWSWFCSSLTPAAPCREGDGILSSILSWCALFICLFFFAMEHLDLAALQGADFI